MEKPEKIISYKEFLEMEWEPPKLNPPAKPDKAMEWEPPKLRNLCEYEKFVNEETWAIEDYEGTQAEKFEGSEEQLRSRMADIYNKGKGKKVRASTVVPEMGTEFKKIAKREKKWRQKHSKK